MKYPEARFNSKAFSKVIPDDVEADPWFAGEDLAKAIISGLSKIEHISINPVTALVEEDWGWCICLEVERESFFIGVGEDRDAELDWKVFIAKDFDFFAKVFRKAALLQSVEQLKRALEQVLQSREDVTNLVWVSC